MNGSVVRRRILPLLIVAALVVPRAAFASEASSVDVGISIKIAGIQLSITGDVAEDGTCCTRFELRLDTDGALVPDLALLRRLGNHSLEIRF